MKNARPIEPPCRLVRFEATDGVELPGLLYEPGRKTKRALLWLHGTGGASVFDTRRTNLMAEVFVANGYAFLPFNNRGAHVLKRLRKGRGVRSRSIPGGSAHERIRDCVQDIDGALAFLRDRGYTEVVAIGHSTGANKLALYDSLKKRNPLRSMVLVAGGDDTGMLYLQLGAKRFAAALAKARERCRGDEADELVPSSLSRIPLSWRAFYDMANPDGDYNVFPFLEALNDVKLGRKLLFRHLRNLSRPVLFVYGDEDEYLYGDPSGCVSMLARNIGERQPADLVMLQGADHGFSGFEADLAETICSWLE